LRKPKWKRIAAVIGLFLIALQEREKDRVAEHLLFSSPKNSDYVPFIGTRETKNKICVTKIVA